MLPTRIEQTSSTELTVSWPDEVTHRISLETLRDNCPCAGCKGETILGKHFSPVKLPQFAPGMYELHDMQTVGNYAVQVFWNDGHATGIYTWEYLRELGGSDMKGEI